MKPLSRLFVISLTLIAAPVIAQPTATANRIEAPAEPSAIPLYNGVAPGSEAANQKEVWTYMWDQRVARNVTQPTLTPVLPEKGKANGTAVIVIPGGGFQFTSMDNEGWPIAKWLAARGITAFILKYRLLETPDAEDAFMAQMVLNFNPATPVDQRVDVSKGIPFAIADAQTALRMVRSNAAKWNIDTKRVGLLGFSAGAMTTLGVTLADAPDARPDFIAPIYGSMLAVTPPENAPPMFAAMAADDILFNRQGFGLIESWQKAGRPVEFHLYESGGHGFGSFEKGTTSDNWFEHFAAWLAARGLLTNAK